MEHLTVYMASAIGAVGLYLMVRHRDINLRIVGILAGLAGLAWLFGQLMTDEAHDGDLPPILFYVFALIAIGAAVRMITHSRPVYCALYFVMVVLSTAAVFLLLEAEFMAFALVIVYAGAILITYLFVLMLAQQAPTSEATEETPAYDRVAREPGAAAFIGFLMIALLGQTIFRGDADLPPPPDQSVIYAQAVDELNLQPAKRRAFIEALQERGLAEGLAPNARIVTFDGRYISFETGMTIDTHAGDIDQDVIDDLLPQNIESVGLALVAEYPASLELAGIILLLAMFGAVVLARKQIELGEDEKREAAGMQRLVEHPDRPDEATQGGSA